MHPAVPPSGGAAWRSRRPLGRHLDPTVRGIHAWIGPPITVPQVEWSAALALRDAAATEVAAHCGEPRLDVVGA